MKVKTIGIDLAKDVFGVHGVDIGGKTLVHRRVTRKHLLGLLAKLEPCLAGMEACGSAHHWAREIEKLGHTVKLMSPQFVKPYLKGNKNDPNDAEAICEAVSRPSMRFVPIKSAAQQDVQALHRVREQLLKSRTALVNQVRGLLGEHGIIAPRGIAHLRRLLSELLADPESSGLSGLLGESLVEIAGRLRFFDERIGVYDLRIGRVFAHDERCQRLAKVEGVGPLPRWWPRWAMHTNSRAGGNSRPGWDWYRVSIPAAIVTCCLGSASAAIATCAPCSFTGPAQLCAGSSADATGAASGRADSSSRAGSMWRRWRWRTRTRASSGHCSRAAITIGRQSLPIRATRQLDQTLLSEEQVSPWLRRSFCR